jgi:hypothetical protein
VAAVEARAPIPGPAGKDGERGADGKDGTPGVNGKDGHDGLGFEDLDVEFDGDRTLALKFARGSLKKTFPIELPYMRYQGVYIEGKSYAVGDTVTWANSGWYCREATIAKPGDGSRAWQLFVRKGSDGRDGRDAPGALPVVKTR